MNEPEPDWVEHYLVRVQHGWTGLNLLGVSCLIPFAFLLWLAGEMASHNAYLGAATSVMAILAPISLDLAWRYSRNQEFGTERFTSSLGGGTIFFQPVWLVVSGLALLGAGVVGWLLLTRRA